MSKNYELDDGSGLIVMEDTQAMTVVDAGENYLTARIHPDSPYEIREGKFTWLGEGWNFTGGIAQVFEPWRNVTWRCNSPMSDVVKAIELEKGL